MIKSKNPVYWLLKIKNPTHQIDENLGLNPGWVFWFSSLEPLDHPIKNARFSNLRMIFGVIIYSNNIIPERVFSC